MKKKLATVLIFLILIATPILSVSGNSNIEKNDLKKNDLIDVQEITRTMDEYDDYRAGFWKLDEDSGSTAFDSSGHNFDGAIYGASWTSGYYNSALDFDGVNDYVALDDYAANQLGFNKTDDLIFSLYFKTTQTKRGVLYSVSAPEYNPGSHIAMNPNGTLEFKMWRLACGLLLTSEGVYNDGDWHYVEVWYNGMPANPIVEMYVDNELDNSKVYYVCMFDADMFTKAKIGTRSNDSEHFFDGIIDEVKIIKFPGGNEQNPPSISGPTEGQPEQEYDFSFITNDPEEDDIWLYIDWDDGTFEEWIGPYKSGEEVVLSHEWDVDDKYDITAECKDIWHDSISTHYVVKIGNQPPEPPTIGGPKYGDTHQQLTYTFVTSDEEDEDVKYSIDWGDGKTDETNYVESNTPVQFTHNWGTEDDYYITAQAFDIHGKPGDESVYHIRIGDQPPNMPKIYGEVQGNTDIFYEYGFVSIDPENDNLTYDIDWGDGYIETDLGPYPSGEIFPRSHKWNETGNYFVKARAKDEFDNPSDWSEYKINVPKNKVFNFNLLELLFERFPLAYLIFKNLIGLLKYNIILLENL